MSKKYTWFAYMCERERHCLSLREKDREIGLYFLCVLDDDDHDDPSGNIFKKTNDFVRLMSEGASDGVSGDWIT